MEGLRVALQVLFHRGSGSPKRKFPWRCAFLIKIAGIALLAKGSLVLLGFRMINSVQGECLVPCLLPGAERLARMDRDVLGLVELNSFGKHVGPSHSICSILI